MPTFPVPDLGGTAYQLQIGTPSGAAPVIVSLPGDPDISGPEVEAAIQRFADDLAALTGGPVWFVARYRTGRTEISSTV